MIDDIAVDFTEFDKVCMSKALVAATNALKIGEVPIGAVITYKDQIIGVYANSVESKKDATKHAEMQCLEKASNHLDRWRLTGCTLYVTLEPCLMCLGAIANARISRLIWAADQTRRQECLHIKELLQNAGSFAPSLSISRGLLAKEARDLIQTFFKKRREDARRKDTTRQDGAIV